jgi:hypothetical protein
MLSEPVETGAAADVIVEFMSVPECKANAGYGTAAAGGMKGRNSLSLKVRDPSRPEAQGTGL